MDGSMPNPGSFLEKIRKGNEVSIKKGYPQILQEELIGLLKRKVLMEYLFGGPLGRFNPNHP